MMKWLVYQKHSTIIAYLSKKYYHLSIRTSILVIESCLADEQCWHCNTNSSCDIYVLQSHFQDWVQRAEYLLNETTAVHLKKVDPTSVAMCSLA